MIDISLFKKTILKTAFSGKLVKQNSADESVSLLFSKIFDKKVEMGLISKTRKKLTLPLLEEEPYSIPSSWKWCFLEEISYCLGTKSNQIKANEILKTGNIPVVSQGQSFIDGFTNDTSKIVSDVPVVLFGDHTKIVKFIDFKFVIGADGTKLIKPILVDIKYFYYLVLFASLNIYTLGYARHFSLLKKFPLPICPIEEQKRIANKLDEIFCELDRVEKIQKNLNSLKTGLFNKIVESAIKGQLVDQIKNEGTGEELFNEIQKNSGALKKKSSSKKDDSDDELFPIPASWKWVSIGDIFAHSTGKALNSSDKKGKKYSYITTSNVFWNEFELDNLKEMYFTDEQLIKCSCNKGDLLVLEGGDIGRAAIWNYDYPMRLQNHIHKLTPFYNTSVEFYYYVFYFYKHAGNINGRGIGLQGLSSNVLHSLRVPLPPFEEQKRIVSKIEELKKLCEMVAI